MWRDFFARSRCNERIDGSLYFSKTLKFWQKNSTKEILVKWVRSPNLGVLQVKVFLLSIHISTFALSSESCCREDCSNDLIRTISGFFSHGSISPSNNQSKLRKPSSSDWEARKYCRHPSVLWKFAAFAPLPPQLRNKKLLDC